MTQQNSVEKHVCGCSPQDLHQLYGNNITSAIQHALSELYSRYSTATVVLSGSNAELFLQDSDRSTYNQAEIVVTYSLPPVLENLLEELSSLKTLCLQYELAQQWNKTAPQPRRYSELKLQQDKRTIFRTLEDVLLGSTGTKLVKEAPTTYAELSAYSQSVTTFEPS